MRHSLASALMALACFIPVACSSSPAVPPRVEGEIDYAGWPAVTEKPFEVPEHIFLLCGGPPKAFQGRGPHLVPAIHLYANPTAFAAVRADDTKVMPIGSVVVKEKWWNKQEARPSAYAAMIKREPGYDADNGDWEYVYVSTSAEEKVQRGRIEKCVTCHRTAANKDYLFRTYLSPAGN